jgi:hypothetical protein
MNGVDLITAYLCVKAVVMSLITLAPVCSVVIDYADIFNFDPYPVRSQLSDRLAESVFLGGALAGVTQTEWYERYLLCE